jgi:hypothetical protein
MPRAKGAIITDYFTISCCAPYHLLLRPDHSEQLITLATHKQQ